MNATRSFRAFLAVIAAVCAFSGAQAATLALLNNEQDCGEGSEFCSETEIGLNCGGSACDNCDGDDDDLRFVVNGGTTYTFCSCFSQANWDTQTYISGCRPAKRDQGGGNVSYGCYGTCPIETHCEDDGGAGPCWNCSCQY